LRGASLNGHRLSILRDKPADRALSLSPSVPGAGADSKRKGGETSLGNAPKDSEKLEHCERRSRAHVPSRPRPNGAERVDDTIGRRRRAAAKAPIRGLSRIELGRSLTILSGTRITVTQAGESMKRFVINRHGRIVLPCNFFPGRDFSVFATLEQFDAMIKRDFEEKARQEIEIVSR